MRSSIPGAPDFDCADRSGEFWSYPESRAFAERLMIGSEEDRTLGPVREDAARS